MFEIIANDIMSNKLAVNLLFLIAYEIIISLISYKVLERYSWKECLIANIIITFAVTIIKLKPLGLFKIILISVIQSGIMQVLENYMYNKDYDIRDYILRTTFLNISALGGCISTCLLWSGANGVGTLIKLFGIIIAIIVGINALGYVLLNGQQENGLLILVDSVIYIIGLLLLLKSQGIDINTITQSTETVNSLIKLICLCVVFGIITAITCRSVYDETDEFNKYLIISSFKTYAIDMTIYLGIFVYLMNSVASVFASMMK